MSDEEISTPDTDPDPDTNQPAGVTSAHTNAEVIDAEVIDDPTADAERAQVAAAAATLKELLDQPGEKVNLEKVYAAMPAAATPVSDPELAKSLAGSVLAYYLAWRKQAGLGRMRITSWSGQVRKAATTLIHRGFGARAVLDAVLAWHDRNIERSRTDETMIAPGAIITIAESWAERDVTHGVDGRGLTREQAARRRRADATSQWASTLKSDPSQEAS